MWRLALVRLRSSPPNAAHTSWLRISLRMVARAAERLAPFPDCEARVMDYKSLDAED